MYLFVFIWGLQLSEGSRSHECYLQQWVCLQNVFVCIHGFILKSANWDLVRTHQKGVRPKLSWLKLLTVNRTNPQKRQAEIDKYHKYVYTNREKKCTSTFSLDLWKGGSSFHQALSSGCYCVVPTRVVYPHWQEAVGLVKQSLLVYLWKHSPLTSPVT